MTITHDFDEAVSILKAVYRRVQAGDPEVSELRKIHLARDEVIDRYQGMFAAENLSALTDDDFRGFLQFRNNKHWAALQRMGPAICRDMGRLREALSILMDERRPIRDRLNQLVPRNGSAYIPRLGKAVLTPILLVRYPDRYGVWNQVSEGSMKRLGLWPEFDPNLPFGDRYDRVNEILLEVAADVGVDLWTLDSLWWRSEELVPGPESMEEMAEEDVTSGVGAQFGLERHLQEFLRDNWDHTPLGQDWKLYEEDGDPEAGYEYPCAIGRIDLLARHRSQRRWLVIELKRSQSSDKTVGQVLRYVGWVKERMAADGEVVEGLIIAHQADEGIRFALAATDHVRLMLYEVDFRLVEAAQVKQQR
jgi:hypothetical protein